MCKNKGQPRFQRKLLFFLKSPFLSGVRKLKWNRKGCFSHRLYSLVWRLVNRKWTCHPSISHQFFHWPFPNTASLYSCCSARFPFLILRSFSGRIKEVSSSFALASHAHFRNEYEAYIQIDGRSWTSARLSLSFSPNSLYPSTRVWKICIYSSHETRDVTRLLRDPFCGTSCFMGNANKASDISHDFT